MALRTEKQENSQPPAEQSDSTEQEPVVKPEADSFGVQTEQLSIHPDSGLAAEVTKSFMTRFQKGLTLSFVKTGSFGFDKVYGGGLPRGRMSVLQSPTGLGKTTISLHFAKTICRAGGKVLFLDIESALNESLVEGLGLTSFLDQTFLTWKVQTFSEVEELMDTYSKKGVFFDLIIMDSMTALSSTKLQTGEMKIEDIEPGWQSRLQSNFFLKYKGLFPKWGTHLLMVSQERVHINFRGPSTTQGAGGKPMEFYPDIRVVFRKVGDIIDANKNQIGADLDLQAVKNKVTMPYVHHRVSVLFGKGISNLRACTFLLEQEGAVRQSGSCFVIKFAELNSSVRGRIGLENFIKENEGAVIEFLRTRGHL